MLRVMKVTPRCIPIVKIRHFRLLSRGLASFCLARKSHMRTFIKVCGAFVISALALSGISGKDPHECVRAEAPEIKNNNVHLQYDSWVKPTGDGSRFHFDR